MTIDMPREIPSAPAVSDSSALTSAQADSFKSFDNFQAMQNSRPDTTSGALPDLEITSDDGPGQEQKPPGDSNKPSPSETQGQEQTPPGDPNKPPSGPRDQEQTPPGGRNPAEGALPGQPQLPRDDRSNGQKDLPGASNGRQDGQRTEPLGGSPNGRRDDGRNKPDPFGNGVPNRRQQ